MLSGVFDPFSGITGDTPGQPDIQPTIHIGKVKAYSATTKSCMVLVSSVHPTEAIGPCRVMKPNSLATYKAPVTGDIVVVAFLDGEFNDMVVLGLLA